MKQPYSVFTNVVYLYPAYRGLASDELTLQLFGVSCLVLAVGSGIFHYYHQLAGVNSRIETFWRYWDHRGMYLSLTSALAHIAVLGDSDPLVAIVACFSTGFGFCLFARSVNLYWITGLLVALNVALLVVFVSISHGLLALFLFSAAIGLRQLTNVEGEVQSGAEDLGHSAWHLLTGAALSLVPFI